MPPTPASYAQLKYQLKMRLAQLSERDGLEAQGGFDRNSISAQLRMVLASPPPGSEQLNLSGAEQDQLVTEVVSEIAGTGVLEPLMADPEVTEIMVNGPSEVFVERHGRVERTTTSFQDANHLMAVIERLLDRAKLTVTESEPCVDASLPDGTRINVIIPPLVLNGPTLTLRKKSRTWTVEDMIGLGTLSKEMAEFVQGCVKAKVNLVISGGTSTGKTTLVSIFSAFIPKEERVITIENVAELELPNREHWIRLVGRNANIQGRGEVPLRTLVRNALRMRPDRIILGEARGGEALDVIQAMQTGHEGVITVLHANSPRAALERLETMMLMSGLELPQQACRTQIARAIDMMIHMGRFVDGSRRISTISQVMGASQQGFELEDLFTFTPEGFSASGQLRGTCSYTNTRPKFLSKFRLNNVEVPAWVTA